MAFLSPPGSLPHDQGMAMTKRQRIHLKLLARPSWVAEQVDLADGTGLRRHLTIDLQKLGEHRRPLVASQILVAMASANCQPAAALVHHGASTADRWTSATAQRQKVSKALFA